MTTQSLTNEQLLTLSLLCNEKDAWGEYTTLITIADSLVSDIYFDDELGCFLYNCADGNEFTFEDVTTDMVTVATVTRAWMMR